MLALVLASLLSAFADGDAASPSPSPVPPPAAPPVLTAGTIYAKAREAMYLRTYPRFITYVIDVQSHAFGKRYHEGYRALLRTYDGALTVRQMPVYSTNQPPAPYGFSFFGLGRTGKPAEHIEPPFGVPLLSATYDFDLSAAPRARQTPSPRDQAIDILMGRVIAEVPVFGGDYQITLAGEDVLDGNRAYHLILRPLRDPTADRLRELWVDEQTYDVRQLVTDGIFASGPPSRARWTVRFIQLHGYWLIRSESTDAVMRAGQRVFSRGAEYRGVTYTFGDYSYPGLISELEFAEPQIQSDAVQL